jgi:16S rRNA pseudouridine516 synthase
MRRLDQLLSALGYWEAMAFVKEGRVKLGGVVVKRSDQRVDSALITVNDEPLEAPDGLLAMLYKPVGYSCTHSEEEGQNIYELLPAHWPDRNPAVTSVGRLDKDTSGLLLVTDIGSLVHRYTSPKSDIEKTYLVEVDRELDPSLIDIFAKGDLMLRSEEKPCLPATLEIVSSLSARLTITEGRMFASQGWRVENLHRERFGPYTLGDLAEGEWQMLSLEQVPR